MKVSELDLRSSLRPDAGTSGTLMVRKMTFLDSSVEEDRCAQRTVGVEASLLATLSSDSSLPQPLYYF